MEPFVLEGQGVRLEPLAEAHVPALWAAASGDRTAYQWTWVPGSPDAMAHYVAKALARKAGGTDVPFATVRRMDGMVVGSTRFNGLERWDWPEGSPLTRAVDAVEIGHTWLSAEAQRTAVNTEAKYLMLRHAFEQWRTHRVMLQTDARNERSRAAIERIGARFEGVLRANRPAADGSMRSTATYSIVAEEWPSVKAALEMRMARSPVPATETL